MKKNIKPFYTIIYNINKKEFEPYNIMPYLIEEYKKKKKKKKQHTSFEEFKEFIVGASMYMYWSRCQYELILASWPCEDKKEKIDIHNQIMMNIDRITEILMGNVL